MSLAIEIPQNELNKIEKRFKNFNNKVTKETFKEVDRTAFAISSRAKNDCPVNTGRLRSSIHVENSRIRSHSYNDEEGSGPYDGSLGVSIQPGQAWVGTNVEYAGDVEDGIVKTKNGRQPFFKPAVKWEELKFIANIKRIVKKA